jgi:hypothetical protein
MAERVSTNAGCDKTVATEHSRMAAFARWMLPAGFALIAATVLAQTQQNAPGPSLGDLARQARAQKQAGQDDAAPKAQQLADEMQEEQEDKGSAAAGLKTYNAGDYKLQIPAPFTIAGNDASGIVLNAAPLGASRPMVVVGNPVLFSGSNSDEAFQDFAARITGTYAPSTGCTKITVGGHGTYQCGLSKANLLGHVVSGNAVFVRGAKSIFPVLCVATTESWVRDVYNDPRSNSVQKSRALKGVQQQDVSVRNIWQTCDAIIQSIQLKEDSGAPINASGAIEQERGTGQVGIGRVLYRWCTQARTHCGRNVSASS